MYVIDIKGEQITTMDNKELAPFLNAIIKHEIGHFAFANTEQEAGQIILNIIKKKKEKYN
tara:strand:- start:202 stop:381 length:180 start_codon:yes stop_codon:yes gene_type:complete